MPGLLTGYPTIKASATYRAHTTGYGPWYFSSDPGDPNEGGRFDLPDPHGTCYVASTPEAAVRERMGPDILRGWVTDSPRWRNTTVSILDPGDRPDPHLPLADTTSPAVANYHNADLTGPGPYDKPRAWAAAFKAHGLSGVHYNSRYAPGTIAEAWFGDTGGPDPAPPSTVVPRTEWEPPMEVRVHAPVVNLSTAIVIDT